MIDDPVEEVVATIIARGDTEVSNFVEHPILCKT
jgi:hypothetical protein